VSRIRVIVCRPGEVATIETIADTLSEYQRICGGEIEGWRLTPKLHIFCHGEGRLLGLPRNRESPLGAIHGAFLVTRLTPAGDGASVHAVDLETVEFSCPPLEVMS
jgi:hypothetical protein